MAGKSKGKKDKQKPKDKDKEKRKDNGKSERMSKKDYEEFKKTKTFKFPAWLYGPPRGRLYKVEVEDCPRVGDKAWAEYDSARTAFVSIDMQIDFCGPKGYVDVMGYDLGPGMGAIPAPAFWLAAVLMNILVQGFPYLLLLVMLGPRT